jgi:hypothetical protein
MSSNASSSQRLGRSNRTSSIDSTSSVGSSLEARPQPMSPQPSRRRVYHPVVSSMVRSNTLQDCVQVDDMITQCMNHRGDNTFMCDTAKRYQAFCTAKK